jgi:uncharacterized protein (UPF0212 family)
MHNFIFTDKIETLVVRESMDFIRIGIVTSACPSCLIYLAEFVIRSYYLGKASQPGEK